MKLEIKLQMKLEMKLKMKLEMKMKFSPDFVEMAAFLACNASTKLSILNQC